jgi:hypothetical protein
MEDLEEKQEKPVAPGQRANTGRLLSGNRVFAIILVIVAAVATGVINVGVREYYQPDVRYEEGTWYYAGGSGIVSLWIKNYGAVDAEKIKFTASFDDIVKGSSVNDPLVEYHSAVVITDPEGTKTTTGTIERLVPKQTAVVYFEVRRALVDTVFKEGSFVRSMVYNGGQGKTGEPKKWITMSVSVGDVVLLIIVGAFTVNEFGPLSISKTLRRLMKQVTELRQENAALRRRLKKARKNWPGNEKEGENATT